MFGYLNLRWAFNKYILIPLKVCQSSRDNAVFIKTTTIRKYSVGVENLKMSS